jgi:hypothetical protein
MKWKEKRTLNTTGLKLHVKLHSNLGLLILPYRIISFKILMILCRNQGKMTMSIALENSPFVGF